MIESVPPDLLEAAVEAARRVLRDMELEDVPAALRRVAAYAGGRLPPPFARKLLAELEADPWLREKAAEAWPEADPRASDPRRAAAALFLLRPEGWGFRLGLLAGRAEAAETGETSARLGARVLELEEELEEAARRVRAAARKVHEAKREADRRLRSARAGLLEAREQERERTREAGRRAAELERERAGLLDRLEEQAGRVAMLRDEVLRARRTAAELRSAEEEGEDRGVSVWAARDPVELARALDDVETATRRGMDGWRPRPDGLEPLRLPSGLRPDRAEAVEWLLSGGHPAYLVVDGYNVAFLLDQEAPSRERVNRGLARLRRRAAAALRVVVVYDSSLTGGPIAEVRSGGVEVRFTDERRTADEEVVDLAASLPGTVVVVSNDRAVREGAEAAGAIALWGEALAIWLQS